MTADDAGAVYETGSGPAPTVPAPRHRHPRLARWRAWRRSRPFWGGLLLTLAGLELFAIPLSGVLIHGAVKLVIYIGIGGVFGVLIGALLVLSGLMTWFNSTNKTFYSIAGIVLGIVSFPASNLGGLFLGMLLAIVGGSIAFGWTPVRETSEPVAVPWTPGTEDPEQTAVEWAPGRQAAEQAPAATPGQEAEQPDAAGGDGTANEHDAADGPETPGPASPGQGSEAALA